MQTGSSLTARLTAAFLGVAGSFLLYAAYMAVPPAGFFSGLLAPFPAVYYRLRHDASVGLIIVLGATLLLTALFGATAGVMYLVQCGVIALVMPRLLLLNMKGARIIVWTTALNLFMVAVVAIGFSLVTGQDLVQAARREVAGSIAQAVAVYEKSGVTGDELALLKASLKQASDLIVRIYPALMTVLLMAMSGINLVLAKLVSEKLGIPLDIGAFKDYRNPDILVWLLIVAGFALLAPNSLITAPALNVVIVVATAYFFQGMAVASAVIARQAYAGILKTALYVMLVLQPYLAVVVTILGIFDLWGDFRTPRKQENL